MITIKNNTDTSFFDIRSIADEVWPETYGAILSREQIDYMMEMMYSEEELRQQAEGKGHRFIIAFEGDTPVGFASFEINWNGQPKTKIHKLYVLSISQKKGVGKKLMDYIIEEAKKEKQQSLILNVNRFNAALHFYKKIGFSIMYEEDIDIGNGFLMEDFVMEKKIDTE